MQRNPLAHTFLGKKCKGGSLYHCKQCEETPFILTPGGFVAKKGQPYLKLLGLSKTILQSLVFIDKIAAACMAEWSKAIDS